jgi:hypothetical protein
MLPSQGSVSDVGVVIECSGTLPQYFTFTFFAIECIASFLTHRYKKDERALLGDLRR